MFQPQALKVASFLFCAWTDLVIKAVGYLMTVLNSSDLTLR